MYLAGRYAQRHLVLFESDLNRFYEYDDATGLWRPMPETAVAVALGFELDDLLQENEVTVLIGKRTQNFLRQVTELLKGIVGKQGVFRQGRSLIHVANGVLNLKDDPPTLREFNPECYSRNRSEIEFDESAECPRFITELLRPALSEDDILLLQLYAGQCLIGVNLSQRILLLRGTPGGGKSTLVNILEMVIGTHNVAQLRSHLLTERFEIASFEAKTLLAGKDVPGDFLNHPSAHVLKALVGGDRLSAEEKNVKHRFEVLGDFNVLVTSNCRLHVKLDSDTGAWRRRLLIVDFELQPPEKPIPKFDRVLAEAEGPGILNWCIEGAVRLLVELEATGQFPLTEAQEARIDALLNESDSVRHFVSERVVKAEGLDVTVGELNEAYNDFCDAQGWQAVTTRQFERTVGDLMMEVHRVARRTDIKRFEKNQRGFMHVAIKEMQV